LGTTSLLGLLGAPSALSQIAIGDAKKDHPLLVVVFLRGGVDGLNTVIPYREDDYYKLRPTLSVAAPRSKSSDRAIDLDGNFALNPLLRPLEAPFKEGKFAILHAVGSNDSTRSHFEAMTAMEKGIGYEGERNADGWIARYLGATLTGKESPLRALSFSDVLPESLNGATGAVALTNLDAFQLQLGEAAEKRVKFEKALETMYSGAGEEFGQIGIGVLQTVQKLRTLDLKSYQPEAGVQYGENSLAQSLRQVALLAKSDVGLEVACLDQGGWDSHFGQGALHNLLMSDLASSLSAFMADMKPVWERTVLVVMTEFGRRVNENNTLGTDHGRASVMFVAGGGVKGGRILTKWPGIGPSQVDEVGDLRVAVDYRDPLVEVVQRLRPGLDTSLVFPNHQAKPWGLFS
jgi:uncharacterized protein (DUF1501 family)